MEFRTIAIIAHVDHGKTTLVDGLLKQSGVFGEREKVPERVMDSNVQEKERGITIYTKNASVRYKGTKINILDTPGHTAFGSEVERILRAVDSVLLLVDACEGPMPQTRFVLKKSLALGLKPIVVINKVDMPNANPNKTLNEVFDLFGELKASEEQLDFSYIFTNAKKGIAYRNLGDKSFDLSALFDLILERVKPSKSDKNFPLRFQVINLFYDNFLGRMALGKIYEGKAKNGLPVFLKKPDGSSSQAKISKIFSFEGLERKEVPEAFAGDIVILAGSSDICVGDTVCQEEKSEPLPAISIDPPTISVEFLVNNSPLAGREGKCLTIGEIKNRLEKELETNVGLGVDFPKGQENSFEVFVRAEMQIEVLIEELKREGFELQLARPRVIIKKENGKLLEPVEQVVIETPKEYSGSIIESLSRRKGEFKNMIKKGKSIMLEFEVSTRGLLGYADEFATATKGQGVITHNFSEYKPYKGQISVRESGSIIADRNGKALAFSLWNSQLQGPLFIKPGDEVYEGMIIGEALKGFDVVVNPLKQKSLSKRIRNKSADGSPGLFSVSEMTLGKALGFIKDDELIEVTPSAIRLRKKNLKALERRVLVRATKKEI